MSPATHLMPFSPSCVHQGISSQHGSGNLSQEVTFHDIPIPFLVFAFAQNTRERLAAERQLDYFRPPPQAGSGSPGEQQATEWSRDLRKKHICHSRGKMESETNVLLGTIEGSIWYHVPIRCSLQGSPGVHSINQPTSGKRPPMTEQCEQAIAELSVRTFGT